MTFEKTGLAAILDFMDRPEVEFRKEKKTYTLKPIHTKRIPLEFFNYLV